MTCFGHVCIKHFRLAEIFNRHRMDWGTMSLKTSCALGHVDITSSMHTFPWIFRSWLCMYLWPAFWHTVKAKLRLNGTIYSIKTAELTRLRHQSTVTLWSPFLPFLLYHPFLHEDQGNPIKTKRTKTGRLLFTCRLSFQILLEKKI